MTERRKVVFVGAYGIQNAGDDAALLVLTRGLCERHPDVEFEFSVLSRHPDALIEQVAGARFLANPEYPSREAARGKWFRGFNVGDDRSDLEQVERVIRAADLVVAGAGNVLIDLSIDLLRGPVPLLALYSFLADVHRTPLMLYGISAGPLRTQHGRDLAAWIARRAAAVTVRDAASQELLLALAPTVAVELLPDPVLGLRPASEAAFERALAAEGLARRGSRPRLAVAVRDLDFLGGERALVIETLRRLSARYEFLFVPQCTDGDCDDRREAETVAAGLDRATCHVLRRRHAPDVLMRFYETALATLAIRLHGAVFSVMAGVPVVGLSYLPKVRGFMERVGLGSACFELSRTTPETLAAAVERAAVGERCDFTRIARELGVAVAGHVDRAADLLGIENRTSALR